MVVYCKRDKCWVSNTVNLTTYQALHFNVLCIPFRKHGQFWRKTICIERLLNSFHVPGDIDFNAPDCVKLTYWVGSLYSQFSEHSGILTAAVLGPQAIQSSCKCSCKWKISNTAFVFSVEQCIQ